MAPMTTIRVRGKKTATTDEKWTSKKKRQILHLRSPSERGPSAASGLPDIESQKRKKRKRTHPLSKLEQLPTEILQAIFVFSANPELPLSSPRLGSQLKGKHLHDEITSGVLGPLFGTATPASEAVVANAARLMNSRFFTWPFFATWLKLEQQANNIECLPDPISICFQFFWGVDLLPPRKLLRAPFTKDKVQFLKAMNRARNPCARPNVPPLYRELAIQAAPQAFAEGSVDTVKGLIHFCLNPNTDLLRLAVMDGGCEKDTVSELIAEGRYPDMDPLDATIWTWAERARAGGNEKGQWLMSTLTDASRLFQYRGCP